MASKITFHPVVFANHKKEDGTYNIKIRVTFKRKDRKLATNLFARKEDLTRSLAIKNTGLQDKADALIREMRKAVDDLNIFALEEMDIEQVVEHIRRRMAGNDFRLDFFAWAEEAIKTKGPSSRVNYSHAVSAFREFLGRSRMDINEITTTMMREYEDWLRKKYGRQARAVSMYTSGIAHIHSLARRKYNDEEAEKPLIRNPFEYYKPVKQAPGRHRNIDAGLLREMMQEREDLRGQVRMAVDYFLISFCLMGANLVDIFSMRPEADGVIVYNRAKTRDRRTDRAEMRVRVEEPARGLVNGQRDRIPGTDREFSLHRRYGAIKEANKGVNEGLRRWCQEKGLEPFTFYAARHTWATQAYSIGINPAIITDALCHIDQGRKVDNIYIAKDWGVIWEANLRVINSVLREENVKI